MKTYYTLGFLFDKTHENVLLIRKNRPSWQRLKLNGCGGHTEEGEEPEECISREFDEEVSHINAQIRWLYYAAMDNAEFRVDCFVATGCLTDVKAKTDEPVEIIKVADISKLRGEMVENLPWLIYMALDNLEDNRPTFAMIHY